MHTHIVSDMLHYVPQTVLIIVECVTSFSSHIFLTYFVPFFFRCKEEAIAVDSLFSFNEVLSLWHIVSGVLWFASFIVLLERRYNSYVLYYALCRLEITGWPIKLSSSNVQWKLNEINYSNCWVSVCTFIEKTHVHIYQGKFISV